MGAQSNNHKLVRSAAEQALAGRRVSPRTLKLLRERGLCTPTTRFRSESQFPGEVHKLHFRYGVPNPHDPSGWNTVEGFIGFDADYNLIVIDQRTPSLGIFVKQGRYWKRRQ